ncbi:MBL fold metallo-hydrolase [Sediminitomix flava]|uniref:Glyoxylase-like metal-dependent hydrolase (Beta-lactamase superfamily II) n=1 Tax=Sediminitomix flava TaxID=379075 RepID=A0A315ZA18_SEDFL|nr:MBL fold metallo-hydrolase [Sediminitomix flava]PWJ42170.1 glyoxylase-like metal-dependent hydrolase (beta-lactamase superfamily II) [Sediminitomix flava]
MVKTIDLNFLGKDEAIASFIIPTSEGPVLVETGPYSTYPNLEKAIELAGYKVSDVKHVLLTHIHLDHAGAAWKFAEMGATIYMHPFGKRHMVDPSKLMASARMIYKDQMDVLWGDMKNIPEEKIVEVQDDQVFQFGDTEIKAWYTPGHAKHHIAWQLGDSLFTGDVAGVKIGNGPVVSPCPPPDINLEDWKVSLDLIRKIAPARLFLTHYGEITEVEAHLDALEKDLHTVANWIRARMKPRVDVLELTKEFNAFCQEELRKQGVDEVGIAQYDAANPAWMSVAGLMRYWTKKAEIV